MHKKWVIIPFTGISDINYNSSNSYVFLIEGTANFLRKNSMLLAILLLRKLTQQDLVIKKNKQGKPYIPNSSLAISLSHSANYLAIAFSQRNVGIDIEYLRYPNKWLDLFYWITQDVERPTVVSSEYFLRCWTSKEAVYKFIGGGLNTSIQNIFIRNINELTTCRLKTYDCYLTELPKYKNLTISIASLLLRPFELYFCNLSLK